MLEGNPQFGVELQPIDFAGIAKNCGAVGFTIEDPRDAESTLRAALAHPGPALVQAIVDPNERRQCQANRRYPTGLALYPGLGPSGEKDRWDIIKTVLKDR